MDAEQLDRLVREQLEENAGRRFSDAEWEAFKQRAREAPASHRKPRRVASGAWSFVQFVGMVLLVLLVGAAVWLVGLAILVGVVWAYSPGTLDRSRDKNAEADWAGAIFFLWLTGYGVLAYWPIARVVIALSLFIGVIALAIGAIVRAAGAIG